MSKILQKLSKIPEILKNFVFYSDITRNNDPLISCSADDSDD